MARSPLEDDAELARRGVQRAPERPIGLTIPATRAESFAVRAVAQGKANASQQRLAFAFVLKAAMYFREYHHLSCGPYLRELAEMPEDVFLAKVGNLPSGEDLPRQRRVKEPVDAARTEPRTVAEPAAGRATAKPRAKPGAKSGRRASHTKPGAKRRRKPAVS